MSSKIHLMAAMAVLALAAAPGFASPIFVYNFSFETLPDGGYRAVVAQAVPTLAARYRAGRAAPADNSSLARHLITLISPPCRTESPMRT